MCSINDSCECYYTHTPAMEKARDALDLLGEEYRRVTTGFSFIMCRGDNVRSVSIHRGFLTNGSSLPLPARALLEKWLGKDHPAIVLHDWLSEYLLIEYRYYGVTVTIQEALDIFTKALEITSLTPRQIRIIRAICKISFIGRKPNHARLNPFKRYVEDKSYGTFN